MHDIVRIEGPHLSIKGPAKPVSKFCSSLEGFNEQGSLKTSTNDLQNGRDFYESREFRNDAFPLFLLDPSFPSVRAR